MNLTIITDKFWENGGSLTEIKIVFVNGKIRLLRKVENPSVPFSLTISKIVHIEYKAISKKTMRSKSL